VNLFAKIFFGFWLSTAAIIASWLLAGQYFTPSLNEFPASSQSEPEQGQPFPPQIRLEPGPRNLGPDSRSIYRIFYGLQTIPREELGDWIRHREQEDDVDIRVVDNEGEEIFGRRLLPGSDRVVERLEGFRRRVLHREGDRVLFGQEMFRPEWGSLKLIIARRPPTSAVVRFLTEHLWLRLLLALLISGAISYAVSRYLTGPLKNLQRASRDLAGGNLAARIEVPDRGGDETDALARDFNTMAAQLQEKISTQKRLLRDVSHELRSPLARMRVALALAEKDPARGNEQLARIERETEMLDELVGQLLSAPDTQEAMQDSLDLVALLSQVCEDAAFEAEADNKELAFTSNSQELVVRSRGTLLQRAFENVIRNAVRYTSRGTTVLVDLGLDDQRVTVTVRDSGPGVPDAELGNIFDPFYRIDEARQRETGGFGLGLSIAQRAIQQHGGSIRAANLPAGGLQVTIQLPVPD
jgi:two-component system sensor histidine kinase CpxA